MKIIMYLFPIHVLPFSGKKSSHAVINLMENVVKLLHAFLTIMESE